MINFLLPRLFIAISGIAALSGTVAMSAFARTSPSFDCAKATTEVEKTVCASPDLAKADQALAEAYRAVLARAPEAAKVLLRADQRAWVAHVGKTCQARWAPKEGGEGYVAGCIVNAYQRQTEFYQQDALNPLPSPYGFLLARQVYRSSPITEADQILDHLPRIRTEENVFPQFLAPALKALSATAPTTAVEEALETSTGFNAILYENRLLILEETTYTYGGGAHGLYGSEFTTIDLARARKLTEAEVFLPKTPWRALLAQEADKSLRAIAKNDNWEYWPLSTADMIKAVSSSKRWTYSPSGFGVYFGIYEVGPYAIGAPIAEVPYEALREVLTPEFRKLIYGVK